MNSLLLHPSLRAQRSTVVVFRAIMFVKVNVCVLVYLGTPAQLRGLWRQTPLSLVDTKRVELMSETCIKR